MKLFICFTLLVIATFAEYQPTQILPYVSQYWQNPNHDCSDSYISCSPWSCWGEYCGYESHGGDCANFVSQTLISAGHPPLNQGFPCRGYPCGKEEVGARNLDNCLAEVHKWNRTCGLYHPPPKDVAVGDVLIYHNSACDDIDAHATIVTSVGQDGVKISCHSPSLKDWDYRKVTEKKYYSWLKYPGQTRNSDAA